VIHGRISSLTASSSLYPSVLTLEDLGKEVVLSSAWIYHTANPGECPVS
jgi:hypothetical protein